MGYSFHLHFFKVDLEFSNTYKVIYVQDLSRIFLEVVSSTLNLIADFFCGLPSLSLYKAFNLVFIEMTLFWYSYLIAFTWCLDGINAKQTQLAQKGLTGNTAHLA